MINLKKIIRSIFRQRLNSGIIVVSLAIGLACLNLITNFIHKELTADNFHKYSDRIYSLQIDDPMYQGQGTNYARIGSSEFMKSIAPRINYARYGSGEYMKENFSQVEDVCRIGYGSAPKILVNEQVYFDQPGVVAVSGNFFDFFSYPLLYGNPSLVLSTKNDIVISEQYAKKYFGSKNALGKTFEIDHNDRIEQMTVTGVFHKTENSTQLKFDMARLAGEADGRCYIRLSENATVEEVEKLCGENKARIPIVMFDKPGQYYLQSLQDNYFDASRINGFEKYRDKKDLKIAIVIALIIMMVAISNFLGLLNNNLLTKQKNRTIQLINGGSKRNLLSNIMIENILLIVVSFVASAPVMLWMMSFFNNLTNAELSTGFLIQTSQLLISGFILTVLFVVTFLFVLVKLHIKTDLGKMINATGKISGKKLRMPAFNIFQMASTIALIICSIVIIKQNKYIADKEIGIDKEVIEVKIPHGHGTMTSAIKEELESFASIDVVSISNASPLLEYLLTMLNYKEDGVERQYSPAVFLGDENYISALGLKLIEGEGFTGNPGIDKNRCVINESLAKIFKGQNLIGKRVPGQVVIVSGIVEDFHYNNLKSKIEPGYISYDASGTNLLVKPKSGQYKEANEAVKKVWESMIPEFPLNVESLKDRYANIHRENKNYIYLIVTCAAISIFLSMIGLFAISFLDSKLRIKEIGVRKVNGAKVNEIVTLLNMDFIKCIVMAFILASPISWYFTNKWLEGFAYKTEFSWWIFALSGILTLVISLITVSWESWQAARRNPVEALRYE